jgi:hypothetical protein
MASGQPPSASNPDLALKGLQAVATSLIGGLVFVGAAIIAVTFMLGEPMLGDPWAGAGLIVAIAGLVSGLAAVFAGLVLFPKIMANSPLVGSPLGQFQGGWFVRAGMIEGAGIIQSVLFMATSNPLLLVGACVALVALVSIYPSDQRYAEWLATKKDS